MYLAAGIHMIFYIIFAWIGETIVVVIMVMAVAMAEVVGTKMAAAEDIAVGRLGSDITRVIVWGYLGELSARMRAGQNKVK